MVNNETTSANVTASELSLLSQLDELRIAWKEDQSARAEGGLLALSGFEHQFLLTLLKIVYRWKEASEAERQDGNTAHKVLTEAISDITESGVVITLTQVKRTLSGKAIREALEELWKIFILASERTPELVEHLRFKISGKFEDTKNPSKVIKKWNPTLGQDQAQMLDTFKTCVSYELVSEPRTDLTAELENLSRDEDTETTIGRWLGYLLQLGSGLSPERISALIWRELIHDKSLEAFRATQARLLSQSRYRLRGVRHTLGGSLSLPRIDLLSQLRASVLTKRITLLIGSSGSGKSALCKLAMQTSFQDYTRLFLHPSDIIAFTETSDSTSSRDTRRIDELLTAQVIEKPIIIIDDLSDVNEQSFDCVLNLLQNALVRETSDVRFVLVAHLDAERRVRDKIAARLGAELSIDVVKLPQLPINDLQSSNTLPGDVTSLVQRADEFGPALNLKLLDWLISSVQRDNINNISSFKNDLDLLAWFWRSHVGNGCEVSEEGSELIRTAISLANNFTPDLSLYDSGIGSKILCILKRRDCLRVVEDRVAVTHRFVGDCARFRYLLGKRRELEVSELATKLRNPLWSQPVRWFALYLAMQSGEAETWQELLREAKKGNHLQLIDLLLDGAILSRKGSYVLQSCSGEHLPFFIERLISRLLAIATFPNPALAGISESTSAGSRLVIEEQIAGIPKVHLWEPVWRWLFSQNPETVIEESCLVFKAAEAWLKWGKFAEKFSLRVEVAEFVLNLLQRILLPDPQSEVQVDSWEDPDQILERRQKGESPYPVHKKYYGLGKFSSNAFACIVFALKIIPERSAWFLRALAGREIVPANRLEPTETSHNIIRYGVGVLESPHPKGPSGKVDKDFRNFMLKQGGKCLNCVVRVNPQLGAELLLALTISPPGYRYEFDRSSKSLDALGTESSDDLDVCTFKFIPLLSLLQIDEVLAVDVIATLCNVATDYWHEHCWAKNKLEDGNIKTDTDGVTLLIGENRKHFKGGRHALYWHRKYPSSPKIVACFLMTLEGWLYSRPTKPALERSISIIFERADTVAMLGVLISLAKWDPNLLKDSLLPLLSSLQLWVWLEIEFIDQGQLLAIDLPHRKKSLLQIAHKMWLKGDIPFDATSQILADWDNHQLNFIPEVSRYRALKIRACFDGNNWLPEENEHRSRIFRFVGTLPEDAEVHAKAEFALWNYKQFEIVIMCRQILDGELQKTPELHRDFVTLLTSEEQLTSLQEGLRKEDFIDIIWAAIAILLAPPINPLTQDLEDSITYNANDLSTLSIILDKISRHNYYNMDAEGFIAHTAPKLLQRVESESSLRVAALRCLIGVRDCNTSAFMRSWIREYGLVHPLTQELINIVPRIARLISLIHAVSYAEEISKREYPQIEKVWSSLQDDFENKKIPVISIIDALKWTPEILITSLQQQPRRLQNYLDWDFLAAALIPVLEAKPDNEIELNLISSLCQQVLFALFHERATVYVKNKAGQEEDGDDSVETQLYSDQSQIIDTIKSQIIDTIVKSTSSEVATRINLILQVLKNVDLVDCIVLGHVVDSLSYCIVESNSSDIIDHSFRNYTACTFGEYLFNLRNQPESNLRFLGRASDVWEKLIDLLWEWPQNNIEKATQADQWLVKFLKRFQEVLLPDWCLRKKLYEVGKSSNYREFRRVLFTKLIQDQKLLPTSRNESSELLVQLLAELWASDCTWITEKQRRLSGLQTLLGPLQEVDAVGARRLADQIADSLVHPSDETNF